MHGRLIANKDFILPNFLPLIPVHVLYVYSWQRYHLADSLHYSFLRTYCILLFLGLEAVSKATRCTREQHEVGKCWYSSFFEFETLSISFNPFIWCYTFFLLVDPSPNQLPCYKETPNNGPTQESSDPCMFDLPCMSKHRSTFRHVPFFSWNRFFALLYNLQSCTTPKLGVYIPEYHVSKWSH